MWKANPILNPHVRYFDGLNRGYLRCLPDRDGWRTDVRTVDTIEVRQAPVRTGASFVIPSGASTHHPGVNGTAPVAGRVCLTTPGAGDRLPMMAA